MGSQGKVFGEPLFRSLPPSASLGRSLVRSWHWPWLAETSFQRKLFPSLWSC